MVHNNVSIDNATNTKVCAHYCNRLQYLLNNEHKTVHRLVPSLGWKNMPSAPSTRNKRFYRL